MELLKHKHAAEDAFKIVANKAIRKAQIEIDGKRAEIQDLKVRMSHIEILSDSIVFQTARAREARAGARAAATLVHWSDVYHSTAASSGGCSGDADTESGRADAPLGGSDATRFPNADERKSTDETRDAAEGTSVQGGPWAEGAGEESQGV